jgi:hypothetical protein
MKMTTSPGWDVIETDEGMEVVPSGDVIGHEDGPDCACMPFVELIEEANEWLITHNAWGDNYA